MSIATPARQTVGSVAVRLPAVAGGLPPLDAFVPRHIGPGEPEIAAMLATVGYPTLDALADATVPVAIRMKGGLHLDGLTSDIGGAGEHETLMKLEAIAAQNVVCRSFIGTGYYGTVTPPVILRNILENPGWYTQYTPYQAEIAQGRLEALLNFQTMVSDLTGLPLAGASLLDEATAAAEAMSMCFAIADQDKKTFLVSENTFPQTLGVMKTRADGLGIDLRVMKENEFAFGPDVCGCMVQYPAGDGTIANHRATVDAAHKAGALVVMATDLLALTLIVPPGELGADVAVGSAQRFGVPMGFGGPHAAFIATRPEFVRKMPGRIIGVSKDAQGNAALRMAIQTREQHIKREKATSNICTAQALLAIISGMYACYHGPEGLKRIAERVHGLTSLLKAELEIAGLTVRGGAFDTLIVGPAGLPGGAATVLAAASDAGFNLRDVGEGAVGLSLDETTTLADIGSILAVLGGQTRPDYFSGRTLTPADVEVEQEFRRKSSFLTHPVFSTHHSEHEMLRYIFKLMGRDLSLAHSMIPLGSCTMKLNATSEMIPVTWKSIGAMHPFAP